jgi:hypothetical protein
MQGSNKKGHAKSGKSGYFSRKSRKAEAKILRGTVKSAAIKASTRENGATSIEFLVAGIAAAIVGGGVWVCLASVLALVETLQTFTK